MSELIKSFWTNTYLRFILICTIVYLLFKFLVIAQPIVISVAVAYLIAYLLHPFVSAVAKRSNRALGLVLVVLVLFAALSLLWLLGLRVAAQMSGFVADIPNIIERVQDIPYLVARRIDPRFGNLFDQVYINVQTLNLTLTNEFFGRLQSFSGSEGQVINRFIRVGSNGAQVAITLVLAAYFVYNFHTYSLGFLRFFPKRHRSVAKEVFATAAQSVGGYVRAQIFISLIIGVLSFIGMSLVGVPLAAALGVIAAISNLIPFLGPIITAVPALLLALTESTSTVIGTLIVLFAINQIDAHVISPMVFSRVNELDPVVIIIAILFGATFFGLVGAILAVPFAAFLSILFQEYYFRSKWYKNADG